MRLTHSRLTRLFKITLLAERSIQFARDLKIAIISRILRSIVRISQRSLIERDFTKLLK